uniref:G-protein coupled receptors family 1 profile domain-containing protein n=1 Tax=Ditylenchus dipsaci TaxID=166011 RepID=A0A915D4A0_9BILA
MSNSGDNDIDTDIPFTQMIQNEFVPAHFILLAIKALIGIVGIFLNLSLVLVTVKNKSLQDKFRNYFWSSSYWQKLDPTDDLFLLAVYSSFYEVRYTKKVLCMATDVTPLPDGDQIFFLALIINLLGVFVYLLFGLELLRASIQKRIDVKSSTSMFKSLLMIMLVDLIGWGSNSLFMNVSLFSLPLINLFDPTSLQRWCVSTVVTYLLAVATACDAPILYWCSKEYRKAYQKMFGLGPHREQSTHQVEHLQTTKTSSPINFTPKQK